MLFSNSQLHLVARKISQTHMHAVLRPRAHTHTLARLCDVSFIKLFNQIMFWYGFHMEFDVVPALFLKFEKETNK